jgi:hypothetical protein
MLSSGRLTIVTHDICRDEAENATELTDGHDSVASMNNDALHVQGNDIEEHIQTFADAYVVLRAFLLSTKPNDIRHRSDLLNERLPTFTPQSSSIQPNSAPSMRRGTTGSDEAPPFGLRIRKTMEEDNIESVLKLADQVARSITGRPHEDRFATSPHSERLSAGMSSI